MGGRALPCFKAPGVRRHAPHPLQASPSLPEALPVFVLIRLVIDWFRVLFCFWYLALSIRFEYNCHRSHYLIRMQAWELGDRNAVCK